MSEKGYYSGNSNILETLVDCTFDLTVMTAKLSWKFFKWTFDGWIDWSKYEQKDLDYFYQATATKNKLGEEPKQLKIKSDTKQVIKVPVGLNIKDFEKTKDSLEAYLNYDVDMKLDNGYLTVTKAEKKELPRIANYELPTKDSELVIPFAISIDGIEAINFNEEPHVLLTGATGSGKSITLRNITTSIIHKFGDDVELVLIDFKIVELSIFKNLKQVESYVTEVNEAKETIADELEICKERYRKFEEIGVTNITDYNKKVSNNKKMKYRFIVIEEFIMLTEDKKKVAMSMLKRLASISRASGQFLIITGQRFDNTVIDLVLRANIGQRLCHKMQDEANSKLILDEVGAELLSNKGRMIYKCGSRKVECQSYYISDEQIRSIIKPYMKPKKELNGLAKGAVTEAKNQTEKVTEHTEDQLKQVAITEDNTIIDLSFIDRL